MAELKLEDVVASLTDFDESNTNDESNCLTNVPSGAESFSDDGLPPAVCSYYANSAKGIGQGCLRVNCKFFHGTEEQLTELRQRCLLDEPLAAGLNAVGAAKRRKMTSDVCSSAKRPIVCLNFLTDACHRPNCRFLHLPPEIRPLPMNICEYFLRGNCTRHRCRFFHGPQDTLTKLHANGVTMYNPITNLPYDPKASLEDLVRGNHSHTTLAPSIQCVPKPSQHIVPQGANTVFIVLNQRSDGFMIAQQPDGFVVIQQGASVGQPPQYPTRPPVGMLQGVPVSPYAPQQRQLIQAIHHTNNTLQPSYPAQAHNSGHYLSSYPLTAASYAPSSGFFC